MDGTSLSCVASVGAFKHNYEITTAVYSQRRFSDTFVIFASFVVSGCIVSTYLHTCLLSLSEPEWHMNAKEIGFR